MRRLLFALLILSAFPSFGSHIVGGEFQIIHLTDYQYRINLIIYFDEVNGEQSNKQQDQSIQAKIFRDIDGVFMRDVTLAMASITNLGYTQPACSSGEVVVSRMLYTTTVILDPNVYNHIGGYYIAWERCCRNYTISNIYSQPPGGNDPQMTAGQTFFMHFPPVVRNNIPFVNSAPVFTTPQSDYVCSNRIFAADFSATDADGDSLVFNLVAPLSIHEKVAYPAIQPKPFPEATWRAPFNLGNIMGGNPDLHVSAQGILRVNPPVNGLYAFAVQCLEYRGGMKIGEVRREFQWLVMDCPSAQAPIIAARPMEGVYAPRLDIHFDSNTTDDERCIVVKVQDNDSQTGTENIRITAIPIGFEADVAGLLPDIRSAALTGSNAFAEFTVCFRECPPVPGNAFQIGIIAHDDECMVPLSDTVVVSVTLDFDIPCAHQTINFPQIPDKIFGDLPFDAGATATSGLPVAVVSADESMASVSGSVITMLQPGLATVVATQNGDDHYVAASPVSRTFCINPLPPLLTLDMQTTPPTITSSDGPGIHWFRNGDPLSHVGNVLLAAEPGRYSATLTKNGCTSGMSDTLVVVMTSVNPNNGQQPVVFPNPTEDVLNVELPEYGRRYSICLIDLHGQRLTNITTYQSTTVLDLSEFPRGLYVMRIQSGDVIETIKVIRQ